MPCSQIDNPDSKKVAEVASAAGEKWRSLSEEDKRGFEESSDKAKVSIHIVSAAQCLYLYHDTSNQKLLWKNAVRQQQ